MKKVSVNKKASKKKKKQRTTNLGEHGFYYAKIIDGKTYQREVTGRRPLEKILCAGYKHSFQNEQGRGSHKKPVL